MGGGGWAPIPFFTPHVVFYVNMKWLLSGKDSSNLIQTNGVTVSSRTGGQGHPSPIHTPTPTPTHTDTQKVFKTLVSLPFNSITTDGPVDQWTNRPMDGQILV